MMSRNQRGNLKRKGARLPEKGEFKLDLAVFVLGVSSEASIDCYTRWLVYKLFNYLLFYSSLKIVDDDVDWKQMVKEEEEVEEDEEEAPVVRSKLTAQLLLMYFRVFSIVVK